MALVQGIYPMDHYRGDAYIIQWTVLDENPDTKAVYPIDITDILIDMQIRPTPESDTIIYTPVIEKTDPKHGIFQWRITPTVTKAIPVGTGVYDIQLTIPNTSNPELTQIVTILKGTWTCYQDTTRK